MFPTLPTAKALQADPRIAIPAMHTMLRHFEGAEPDRRTRLFSMLPTKRGFRAAHITICSSALRDLLLSADIRDDDFMERKGTTGAPCSRSRSSSAAGARSAVRCSWTARRLAS